MRYKQHMKKVLWAIASVIIIVGSIYSLNYFSLNRPVKNKTNADARNHGIKFDLHYKNYVQTSMLVFNLTQVKDKAPIDVFRLLLQTASALKNRKFKNIQLSYKGAAKFTIKGEYFSELGNEYGEQNVVYTIRTFAENLYDNNGQLAYSEWTGGIIGVLEKQMEDFEDFNKKWYINEISTSK